MQIKPKEKYLVTARNKINDLVLTYTIKNIAFVVTELCLLPIAAH